MSSKSESEYHWIYRDLLSRSISYDDRDANRFDSQQYGSAQACSKYKTTLSVFDCKCAIIQLYGKNIPTKEIARILQNACSWVPDGTGVTYDQFHTLLTELSSQNIVIKASASTYYNYLDKKGKGWINVDDFRGALSTVAPLLARKYADDIFALADIHHVGQVTKRSYVANSHHNHQSINRKAYNDDDDDD